LYLRRNLDSIKILQKKGKLNLIQSLV
jgi:hypothetical protein